MKPNLLRWLPILLACLPLLLWRTPWSLLLGLLLLVAAHRLLARWVPDAFAPEPDAARDWRSHVPAAALFSGYPVSVDRVLDDTESEIGMGGPRFASVLLADGMLVDGVRLQAPLVTAQDAHGPCRALLRARGDAMVLADLATHTRYTFAPVDGPPAAHLLAQWAGLPDGERAAALRAAMACCAPEPCVALRGLWLQPALRADAQPEDVLERRLPSGRHLQARTVLPPDLRAARNPAQWVQRPPNALWLDGQPTPHHVIDLDDVAESPDGRTLVLHGVLLGPTGAVREGVYHLARLTPGAAPHWFTVRSWAQQGGQLWRLELPHADNGGTVTWRVAVFGHSDVVLAASATPPEAITLPTDGFDSPTLRLPLREDVVRLLLPVQADGAGRSSDAERVTRG
ncbi:MAG: hypothetical protein Q4G70_07725 [Pseudomonadota bacterium]|nr:hypothetical protein [Pseudomonadota bacterium]